MTTWDHSKEDRRINIHEGGHRDVDVGVKFVDALIIDITEWVSSQSPLVPNSIFHTPGIQNLICINLQDFCQKST